MSQNALAENVTERSEIAYAKEEYTHCYRAPPHLGSETAAIPERRD
jgi:hypothetical protein